MLGCRSEPAASTSEASRASPPAAPAFPDNTSELASNWTALLAELRAQELDAAYVPTTGDRSLASLLPRPRPLAVQIFATYCPPCIEEMPIFNALHEEGAAIAGLSMDPTSLPKLKRLLEEQQVRYPVSLLTEASMKRAGAALPNGLPATLILSSSVTVSRVLAGRATRAEIVEALKRAR